jgi:hypothetical protein
MTSPFLTLHEAAQYLRTMTEQQLKVLCRNGEFPGRKHGRSWVVHIDDLVEWSMRHRAKGEAKPLSRFQTARLRIAAETQKAG